MHAHSGQRQHRLRNRLLTSSILAVLSLTLLFLGMRPASLNPDPHQPKPRPRAVVESQVKSADECGAKHLQTAAAVQPRPVAVAAPAARATRFVESETATPTIIAVCRVNSRAPPLFPFA